MNRMMLQVAKLSEKAMVPTRGSPLSAGYDLYSAYDATVPAGGKALVKTDIAVKCPVGTYGRVAPRSGLAWKSHIDVGAGVIDADYRGNVGVVLFNHSKVDLPIKAGDRIAQLVLEKVCMAPIVEVPKLEDTERGAGGFGSTGMRDENLPQNSDAPANEIKRQKLSEDPMESLLLALPTLNLTPEQQVEVTKRIINKDVSVRDIATTHIKQNEDLAKSLVNLID
mmetsp:Transcript_25499/g.41144  ORF Transcript_25499/g.41144 Transcript_25499/m.41144 type:complete len:224 (-) Transcript_25499:35-706(-)|eukprot:CAMPEP_0203775552 /NCGR_PEP_ID=MMETSP0099_2-20121227/6175_1 /ASSEMBLY_ACC=CAM_ASM_000209 /TAXON_ID=96639 /ORGANISM=" , Strain NY0313808BC1" /LENGTH=223 /DNA_ID=CAMNT_0050674303 /DNA_START=24 /DNA_END=695 /DNA_ORIENTATION=+